jgi:hypothetical protein
MINSAIRKFFTRLRIRPETRRKVNFPATPVVPGFAPGRGPRMEERRIENGAKLGWLIDAHERERGARFRASARRR